MNGSWDTYLAFPAFFRDGHHQLGKGERAWDRSKDSDTLFQPGVGLRVGLGVGGALGRVGWRHNYNYSHECAPM